MAPLRLTAHRAAAAGEASAAGAENRWQRDRLPGAIRDPVPDDQQAREICWSVFDR